MAMGCGLMALNMDGGPARKTRAYIHTQGSSRCSVLAHLHVWRPQTKRTTTTTTTTTTMSTNLNPCCCTHPFTYRDHGEFGETSIALMKRLNLGDTFK